MSLSRKIAKLLIDGKTETASVVSLLEKYKMSALLPSITKELEALSLREGDKEKIFIESPFPLSESSVAKIKRIVGNDLASHEVVIKKEILAGFKARFKGNLYDGSAERIIKQLSAK